MTVYRIAFVLFVFIGLSAHAQQTNWQNKDLKSDTVFGISTEKAYRELLPKKKATTVRVAVIDSGVDTTHEDLKAVIWNNKGEIPGNGVDDDHNGYADDTHGWNFIGGPKGDVNQDNLEVTRLLREGKDSVGSVQYQKMKKEFDNARQQAEQNVGGIGRFRSVLDGIVKKIGKDTPVLADFQAFTPGDGLEQRVRQVVIAQLQQKPDFFAFRTDEIEAAYTHYKDQLDYSLNMSFDPRSIVGDDYNDSHQRYYGNTDVYGPHADHGTHVAGIIGAVRNNGIGIDGIADKVEIMVVRVVPDGDERDKDVANGIRYAADNGARVINMSFGKAWSKDKKAVDEAVQYAMSKDVLIIHAAGNDGKDLDDPANQFVPNKYYADNSGVAGAWIQVGASGPKDDSTLVASFSNYGHTTVDVFAPGVDIYSSTPGSHYAAHDGTSMAAPVVTGLAALIREYYPKLTAIQVKEVILQSVVKPDHTVMVKRNGETAKVSMGEICVSGGVVNVFNALELAAHYKAK
ncbi:MAG TPA: S8 family peptidase [Puia sp.]|jgi:subtilisin family serine protease